MNDKSILENSIAVLGRLQGIGPRSARRVLIDLMKKKDSLLAPLIKSLEILYENIQICSNCFNIDTCNPCSICSNINRNSEILCVVEDISSLWAIEKTKSYNGLYFVLGGNLSMKKRQDPESLNFNALIQKVNLGNINEIIIATSATIEGQITANYILDSITEEHIKVSMLAQGIPVGGEIDYLDDITLSTALKLRKNIIK